MKCKYTLFVCVRILWQTLLCWQTPALDQAVLDPTKARLPSWLQGSVTDPSQSNNSSSSLSTNDHVVDPEYDQEWSSVTHFWTVRGSGDNWFLNIKDRALWGGVLLLLSCFHWTYEYIYEDKMVGSLEVRRHSTCWGWQNRKRKRQGPEWILNHCSQLKTVYLLNFFIWDYTYLLLKLLLHRLFLAGKIIFNRFSWEIIL